VIGLINIFLWNNLHLTVLYHPSHC